MISINGKVLWVWYLSGARDGVVVVRKSSLLFDTTVVADYAFQALEH